MPQKQLNCPNCENETRLKFWQFEGITFLECPDCTRVSEIPELKETIQ